jgi:ribosomal-protein-alanine N-acetyltransferase
MKFITHSTDRLILREYTSEVQKFIFENYTDEELKSFLGLQTDEELAVEKSKYQGGYTTYRISFLFFQLIEKESQRVIGNAGFHNWYAEHRRAEIGYRLTFETDKNKGYMSEALKFIIHYGFEIMNLNRIEAIIAPYNIPSQKLVINHKFVQEGYLHQHFYWEEKFDDSMLFALLREDYFTTL